MGYQERDYYRDEQPTSLVTSIVVKLIIVNCAILLASKLFSQNDAFMDLLMVTGETLTHPLRWWQFLTAGFAHDPNQLNHIIFNMLGLYFFGKPLEERFGPREFLRYYLVAIIVGMVLWGARVYLESLSLPIEAQEDFREGMKCLGASGGVTACVILFCLLYPRATIYLIVFPLPAWVVGILIVAMNFLGVGEREVAYDVHLFGAAFALAYWYFGWNLGRLPGMKQIGKLFGSPQRWFQSRPALRVHDPDPEPEPDYDNLDTEGDRILAKLHREGEGSLSAKERRILEDYSRRMRQKLR
jgi:membrane associated rhomboid family serine protease